MNKNASLAAASLCAFTGASFGAPMPGLVVVANASQFDYGSLSAELTGYQAGLPSPDLEMMLEAMVPSVEGGRRFEFRKSNDEDFITETDDSDIRAEGADFKKVEYRGDVELGSVKNKGLTYVQDHDKLPRTPGGAILPGWENQIATRLRKRLIRAEILRVMAALRTAAGSPTAKVWNAASNPDGDLRALVQGLLTSTGLKPNMLLTGDASWNIRQDAYEASTRANHNMSGHAMWSPEQLASYLGVSRVMKSEDVYQAKKSGTKAQLVTSEAIAYMAEPGLGLDDRSSIKRVTSPTDAGTRFGVYVETKAKFTTITVEHYSTVIVPWASTVGRYTITAS